MAKRATLESNPSSEEVVEKQAPKPKQERQRAPEVVELDLDANIGDLMEFHVPGEKKERVVFVGNSEEGMVVALNSGLRATVNQKEGRAFDVSFKNEQSMKLALLKSIDNYCKAIGVDAEEALIMRRALIEKSEEIFFRAESQENPDDAIFQRVKTYIDSRVNLVSDLKTAKEQKAENDALKEKQAIAEKQAQLEISLAEATQEYAHAKMQADEAYKTENEKAYQDAVNRCNTAQNLISKLRLELKPNASPAEQQIVKEETKGAVQPEPDELYDEGFEVVKNRLKELEQQMKDADKAKDETAWTVANDEYNRHRVMMPILEQADLLERIDKTVQFTIQNATEREEKKLAFKKEVSKEKVREKMSYWRHIGSELRQMNQQLDNLSNAYDFLVGSGGMSDEEYQQDKTELETAVAELKKQLTTEALQLKDLVTANDLLEKKGLEMNFDQRIEDKLEESRGQQTTLLNKLRDAYTENPDRVMSSVKKLLKSKTIRDTTRSILQAFVDQPGTEQTLPEPDIDSAIDSAFAEFAKPIVEPNIEPIVEETQSDDFEIDLGPEPETPQTKPSDSLAKLIDRFNNFNPDAEPAIEEDENSVKVDWEAVQASSPKPGSSNTPPHAKGATFAQRTGIQEPFRAIDQTQAPTPAPAPKKPWYKFW